MRFLPDPTAPGQSENDVDLDVLDDPDDLDVVRDVVTVLAAHTRTPDDAYFCMWDGWGTPPGLDGQPKVALPNRLFFLFRGALADIDDWDTPRMESTVVGHTPPPAFIWPADRAWCFALDDDPHYAGVGGAPAAVADRSDTRASTLWRLSPPTRSRRMGRSLTCRCR
ncbi:hypothetical protein [Nocardioides sp. AX2bis]|uniref:hypothetical protein n=1 Tax=Nocardioides sp. AX2bis TaxID=2653157 RepID=UPI001F333F42|nr:hypothetical protein [Nocardioides sp. AX2bis]